MVRALENRIHGPKRGSIDVRPGSFARTCRVGAEALICNLDPPVPCDFPQATMGSKTAGLWKPRQAGGILGKVVAQRPGLMSLL